MDFLNATVVLYCNDSMIRVTDVTPSALTGRHCIGWCTDTVTSTIDNTNMDVTTSMWEAFVDNIAHNHNVLLAAVPDWAPDTYLPNSIVWAGGNYYYTSVSNSQDPLAPGSGWSIIPPADPNWSYVISDPKAFNATVFQLCVEKCPTQNCGYMQMLFAWPTCFDGQHAVYFIYDEAGPTLMQAAEYSSHITDIIYNAEQCHEYRLYEFGIIDWVAGSYNVDDFIYYGGNY